LLHFTRDAAPGSALEIGRQVAYLAHEIRLAIDLGAEPLGWVEDLRDLSALDMIQQLTARL
jgi:hypothetical protein